MPGTRAKRVASVTTTDTRPRKRVNRVTSNGSSRAEVDAASNGAPESNETNSARGEDDSEGLEQKLSKSHNTSLPSLLVTLFLSQG